MGISPYASGEAWNTVSFNLGVVVGCGVGVVAGGGGGVLVALIVWGVWKLVASCVYYLLGRLLVAQQIRRYSCSLLLLSAVVHLPNNN